MIRAWSSTINNFRLKGMTDRHGDGAYSPGRTNVLFVDGHGSARRFAPTDIPYDHNSSSRNFFWYSTWVYNNWK
jgi:prepilin-type processing-associated H-X9-DG protein